MKWEVFIGHAVFIGSMLVTAIIVIVFRVLHEKQRRRSPLHGKKMGHVPGQQLLERIENQSKEADHGFDVMMMALPLMFMIWATLKIDWQSARFGVIEAIFLIGWLVFFSYGFWVYQRHYRRREQARDGLLAERVTGMQLNRLVASGCMVMHDLPCDVGNIDHIVIAPNAVFVVETKSFRKPKARDDGHRVTYDGKALRFPDFTNTDAVEQATRNAQWAARYLRNNLGFDVPVVAALALPGWFIDRVDTGKSSPVRVFTPIGRGAEFMLLGTERIDAAQRGLIAQTLATQYPEIKD